VYDLPPSQAAGDRHPGRIRSPATDGSTVYAISSRATPLSSFQRGVDAVKPYSEVIPPPPNSGSSFDPPIAEVPLMSPTKKQPDGTWAHNNGGDWSASTWNP
jgi:hypothetical protein